LFKVSQNKIRKTFKKRNEDIVILKLKRWKYDFIYNDVFLKI